MGIDIYSGDGSVDFEKVRAAGHSFCIAKATEGASEIDPRLHSNLAGMKAAGLVRGVYHFFRVHDDPVLQAHHFMNALHDAGYDFATDLPPALDLEDEAAADLGQARVIAAVSAWLAVVEPVCRGRCIIYTGKYWANDYLGDAFAGHPLWLCQYTSAQQPSLPDGWSKFAIWQWSETGTVAGVPNAGHTDLNKFAGFEDQLRAWAATGVLHV